jgi:group I intron endonuclease
MKASHWTIYCHIHTESGRRYIGLTKKTITRRWKEHVSNAAKKRGKGCHHFWSAIRKYGKDAFSHEILETCMTLESANAAEEKWILQLDSRNPEKGFNLMRGGIHVPHPIRKNLWDDPSYRALVMAQSWDDPAYRAKMSKISREVNSRPEVKAQISAAHTGCPLSQERKDRLSEFRKGKRHNPETLAKLSAIQASDEYRAKQSASHLGKKLSRKTKRRIAASSKSGDPEVRARISASVRAYYSN